MGGPCVVVDEEGKPQGSAPPCTDNFQVCAFTFDGLEWQSCEQFFQAAKYVCPKDVERVRKVMKKAGQSDHEHGMRCWQEGQVRSQIRSDWDAVKVEIMYRANLAKFRQHSHLARDLLSTGQKQIIGHQSVAWKSRSGAEQSWTKWNGLIQMRIREELRPPEERARGLLESLKAQFDEFLAEEGGAKAPLPFDHSLEAESAVCSAYPASTAEGSEPYSEILYGAETPEKLTVEEMEKKRQKMTFEKMETKRKKTIKENGKRGGNKKEKRKGGSGRIGKMLISKNQEDTKRRARTFFTDKSDDSDDDLNMPYGR